jgi:ornithine cyclodeaminase/alanine dehydrogenase-like protein (mu-crystallin family)
MVLLLTRDDLRPLWEDSSHLDGAFQAVEDCLREHYRGEASLYAGSELPLTGPQKALRILPSGSPTNGAGLRLNPLVGRLDNPDSFANLLFDGSNGRLLCLMAGDDINIIRTAVPAGLGAKYLAPEHPRVMGILGTGRQSRGQLITVKHAIPDLERVRVFSPTLEHRTRYAEEMTRRIGIPVEAVGSEREAVESADIVGVTSNAKQPVIHFDWIRPGALVISMSAGQLAPDVVLKSRVIVATRPEVLESKREPFRSLIAAGQWGPDGVAATLAEVMQGDRPGRQTQDQTILYEMPGMSIWDTAIMRWAYTWAVAHEFGSTIRLS